ncbi:TPM domain-containing protein [Rhodopseudomonas palustris]|uniref:TPM domain-containing protein n=1 Tax=Rhodopseudomonas palustris TaxID=1076 RepID=UPI002ACE77A3|nr:TPM domain-containing protein [Rhodopseudomonas palustris]WQH02038.1 TPM domain-containing protein [Rhodopseudomonas palustris]
MGIRRIGKHLITSRWRVQKAFPPSALDAIERAIGRSEARHAGQIRFVVEGALDGAPLFRDQPARERALDVFSQLRIWDTEHNNGVLIYLLLADRDVEIVADRGIDGRVDAAAWEHICREMESAFRDGRFEAGVLRGIELITAHLARHFPKDSGGDNELPDAPVVV